MPRLLAFPPSNKPLVNVAKFTKEAKLSLQVVNDPMLTKCDDFMMIFLVSAAEGADGSQSL